MGWVTLEDGQHIFIGPGGRVEPRGPGSAVSTRRSRKAGQVVQAARQAKARTIKKGLSAIARNRHERAQVQAGIRAQRNVKRAQRHADTAAAEHAARAQATRQAADAARAERATQGTRFTVGAERRARLAEQIRAQRRGGAPRGVVAAIRANTTTTRGVQIRTYGTPEAIARRSNLTARARDRIRTAAEATRAAVATRAAAEFSAPTSPAAPAPARPPAAAAGSRPAGMSQTPNAIRTREQRAARAIRAASAARQVKRNATGDQVPAARQAYVEARQAKAGAIALKQRGRADAAARAGQPAAPVDTATTRTVTPRRAAAQVDSAHQVYEHPATTSGPISPRGTRAFEHATLGETQNVRVTMSPETHELAKRWFGPNVTPEQLASLAGAPDGSRVNIRGGWLSDRIHMSVEHPDINAMQRTIRRDDDGHVRIHNDLFVTAGSPNRGYNGYMTWARFGYDAPLTAAHQRAIRARPELAEHHDATRINQLMGTQAGRDYWRNKGTWTEMKFDLNHGSPSMVTLSGYFQDRQANTARGMSVGLKAFARQVEAAHKMGVHSIDTSAARS